MSGYSFTLGLASLASHREYLNLEKWIEERIVADSEGFSKAVFAFLSTDSGVSVKTFTIFQKSFEKFARMMFELLSLIKKIARERKGCIFTFAAST